MAIHVIQSQRIDVLVQGVLGTKQVASRDPFSVLKSQHFVVPSAAVQEWLTQRLSEQQGVSANTIFHQGIRGFQWFAYQQLLEDKDKVRKANIPRLIMKWRIFQVLKPLISSQQCPIDAQHPMYSLIERIYESASRLDNPDENFQKKLSMLYWIAEQVSKLFSHYMVYRADCRRGCDVQCNCPENWLSIWGRNEALNIEQQLNLADQEVAFKFDQAQKLEAWQRWLWLHTFHDDFVDMQSIDYDFWTILQDPNLQNAALRKLPHQLIVFTVLELPPSQLQFLRRLGQHIDVLILHYNPSQEYWADSVDPNWKKQYDLRLKERFIAKFEKNHQIKPSDEQIQQFFDKFTLNFNSLVRESRHPLLTRMGKQARDHFSLLSSLSSGDEGQWVDAFVDEFPDHLLGQLQSDILHLVEPQPHSYRLSEADDSIKIHVCHSSVRQLEVLKDQLIYWLAQGTVDAPRRPSDILVLVPDLKQIEPLVRSVFPQQSTPNHIHLPVKIAGVTQLDVELSWRAVRGRIELLQGRFSIDDFADWLNLTATQIRYALDVHRTERILELLVEAGFKRGFDEIHLQQSLSVGDEDYRFSFKFALDRLAIGVAIPQHVIFAETLSFEQVQTSDFEIISTLIEIYQDFAERRNWMQAQQDQSDLNVEHWLQRLNAEIIEFEQAGVESLTTIREIILKQIRMLTLASFYDAHEDAVLRNIHLPLPYILTEIQQTLDSKVDQALPTGQITFSQIGVIRPVPYKLVVILNLDSGKFPNRNSHLPFDLMEVLKPQLGDRSRLEDDQGAFLDALLLAQDNLWLFYNGFDISDGEVRDPSSLVQELIQHLKIIVKSADSVESSQLAKINQVEVPENLKSLYRVHELQPFDPHGFGTDALRYQDHWYTIAQQLGSQQQRPARRPWVNTSLDIQDEQLNILDAEQWIRDICFPARLYLKTLGVANLGDEDIPEVTEPLMLDGLARYAIRDYLQKQDHIESLDPDLLLDQLPVGKVQHSTLKMSMLEYHQIQKRLKRYASEPSATTKRILTLDEHQQLQITVPVQQQQDWVSLSTASARAQRRAHIWLEYLLWLSFIDLAEEQSRELQRIVVFSDKTLICSGLSSNEAKTYLQAWLQAFEYAQTQPLVLPAALLMKLATDGKTLEWSETDAGQLTLSNFDKLLTEWNKSDAFLSYSLSQSEESKLHRDWQFILQDQDATALLQWACEAFAYDLYQPIYLYQFEAEE